MRTPAARAPRLIAMLGLVPGLFLALLLALLAVPQAARAEELIESFKQRIEMTDRDRMTVTEEITVMVHGAKIKRGIYRDFPTAFNDADGQRRQVGFTVLKVLRNGNEEPYSTSRNARGVRIMIGNPDILIAHGLQTYTIVYETTRQIRRFADHDELYWNVTGNEWDFWIRYAGATVILPKGAKPREIDAITGTYGDQIRDVRINRDDAAGTLLFETARALPPGEGMTIVVALDKGVIAEATDAERLEYFYLDNQPLVVGGAGILAVAFYYLLAWARVGRDPPAGTIIPLFDAPSGFSPALAARLYGRGITDTWQTISASWVALAVKGMVSLEGMGKQLMIRRESQARPANLPGGEAALLSWLDGRGGQALISPALGKQLSALGVSFEKAVLKESDDPLFSYNAAWIFLGVLLSAGVIAVLAWYGHVSEEALFGLIPALFIGVFVGVLILVLQSMVTTRSNMSRQGAVIAALVIGTIMFSVVGFIAYMLHVEFGVDVNIFLIAFGLIAVNFIGGKALFAPTVRGQKMMDEVEGMMLYLTIAEKDRMNSAGFPAVTPSRYEKLLPYAIALSVEKPWTAALVSHLAAAGSQAVYEPHWYHGFHHDRANFAQSFTSGLSAMSTSFKTSLPVESSSSSGSGGGGRSGGGGGGGGGGGW